MGGTVALHSVQKKNPERYSSAASAENVWLLLLIILKLTFRQGDLPPSSLNPH